jgi:short-subunit dehydrogenase
VLIVLIAFIYALSYYLYKNYFYFPPITTEQLRYKRVIITGASRGIGEELAYEYSRYHCRLVLAARSIDILKNEVAEKCRLLGAANVECVQFDASKEQACIELIKKTIEVYDGIDILVLNHTASVYEPFFDSDQTTNIQNMKKLFETNFFGYFNMSKKIQNQILTSYYNFFV